MSKHSRWSKVKHQKGAADSKRAALFTRLARQITVAARDGGGDPSFNFKLRSAVDQALEGNLPKDNIERAIKKGTGEIASDQIEEIVYEGYGPGGIAILVETLTDNRNRSSATIKHAFSMHGGNLGSTGSVQWMFERKGVVRLKAKPSEEQELALIDAEADDIAADGEETAVYCAPDAVGKVRDAAATANLPIGSLGFEWQTKDPVPAPAGDVAKQLEELLDTLDDNEDVNALYTNIR